ncbi:TIGR03943 family protein [Streptomyces triticagri]|uniref:TIGR03943 family protein n=1 Tax=Streptomyces triticagri TaxID=2293568 RepID=A0A372LZM1_9ACTN|nr:TIGR03943 family protein [Streptomyces triticagri]
MKHPVPAVLLLLVGAALLRITLFGDVALRYVQEPLRPYLAVTGAVLILAAALSRVRDGRGDGHGPPRTAWLLVPPALALLCWAPPALGSYTAARNNPKIVADYDHFDPLPTHGAVHLSLTEFTARVQQEEAQSLRGRTVVLSGFVTPRTDGAWDLSRLLVSCCAADSQSLTVRMHGIHSPAADTWVTVTGTWHPSGTLGTTSAAVALNVDSLQRIPEPKRPYVDRPPA